MESEINQSAIDNIMSRTSIRKFQDRTVENEKVTMILKAAMAAPSAVNKQPWQFVVVDDRNLLQQIASALPYAHMAATASLAIIVCGDMSKALAGEEETFWIQDVSAASENILLASNALGLAAVWTGVYPMHDRVEVLSRLLRLPRHVIPLNVIPIGYPAVMHAAQNKWKEENIHHNGWM
jgi:nitroreductase